MRNALMLIGILLLITAQWTAILGFPKVSGFFGICWSIVMLVYVISGAFE